MVPVKGYLTAKLTLWRSLFMMLSLEVVLGGQPSSYCRSYGGCQGQPQGPSQGYPKGYPKRHPTYDYPYLPAPPGKTPRCAKPGATFCETADHYPAHLVQYLIDRWGFDFNTLLKSESEEDFNFRYPVTYGPYGASLTQTNTLPSAANGSQPFQTEYGPPHGYPDRRYHLDEAQTSITYPPPPAGAAATTAAGTRGQLLASPNDRWWVRYQRQRRQRRQAPTDAPPGSQTLCPTSSRFIAPQAALNTQGNWMFVANVPEVDSRRYTQLVRAETCISSECSGLCSLPSEYTSRCEQQYVQKRLVALGGGGDRLYTDIFWFPHCCVCQIIPPSPSGG